MTHEQAQNTPEQGYRPYWSITQAARECAVSRSTIRRYRERGEFKNAYKDENREWLIPVTDLIAAGLPPKTKPDDEHLNTPNEQGQQAKDMLNEQEHELIELRHQLEMEQLRRQHAESLAQERGKQVDDLRGAMRMIETTSTATSRPESRSEHVEAEQSATVEKTSSHGSLWSRLFGR